METSTTLKGNVVVASLIFAASFVLTGVIVHHGLTSAAGILAGSVDSHAIALSTHMDDHAKTLSTPRLTIADPIAVQQPITIQGPRRDGALPVDAGVGK